LIDTVCNEIALFFDNTSAVKPQKNSTLSLQEVDTFLPGEQINKPHPPGQPIQVCRIIDINYISDMVLY